MVQTEPTTNHAGPNSPLTSSAEPSGPGALNPVATLPEDREIWIVTDDDPRAVQVQFCDDTKFWTGRDEWRRTDGESGGWEASEIAGWTEDHAVAEAAALAALPAYEAEVAAFAATRAITTTCIEHQSGRLTQRLSFQIKVF